MLWNPNWRKPEIAKRASRTTSVEDFSTILYAKASHNSHNVPVLWTSCHNHHCHHSPSTTTYDKQPSTLALFNTLYMSFVLMEFWLIKHWKKELRNAIWMLAYVNKNLPFLTICYISLFFVFLFLVLGALLFLPLVIMVWLRN